MQGIKPALKQSLYHHKASLRFLKRSTQQQKPTKKFPFSKKIFSPTYLQEENTNPLFLSFGDNYTRAAYCISRIGDPLWQNICLDLMDMMGPVSVLKIWKSKLGNLDFPDKGFEIICETEEIAIFVQQYDFVILGSLQRYFPTLKQLRAKYFCENSIN